MSLILEALKKSEAERQRRQTPGLMTPSLAPRRRGPWRWLAALSLLPLTLVGGWWLGQLGTANEPAIVASTPAPAPETQEQTPDSPTAAEIKPTTQGSTDGERRPQAPAQRTPAATPDAIAAAPPRPSREREGAAMLAPASDDPLVDPELDDATRAQLAEVLGALPDPAPTPTDADTRPDRTVAAMPQPPTQRETTGGPAALHELPFQLRRDVPEIKVSMVVSSGDADARFALVNGERRREGDEVAPGVRLIEIRAQTLELEFRGQRFLLHQGTR